ncbi:MAG: efflux transporter outer membrane subunit [Gammaproteobacteria bacterium]
MLAACAEVAPRPPTDTTFRLPGRWSARPDVLRAEQLDRWLATFKDPALSALVHEAISRNYDLRATAARVQAARAQYLIEGAPRLPQLDFSPGLQRSREVFDGAGESAFYQTRWTLPFNLSWEIDLWGRIRAMQKAAESELDATLEDLESARLSLAARTGQAYFELAEAVLQVEVAATSVRDRETIAELVQGRFQRGLTRGLDVRLTLTDVENARAELARAENRREVAARHLEVLLGRYPAGAVRSPRVLMVLPAAVPAGLPAGLLARRPDLKASLARLQAEDWRVASAKAALLPRLTLTGSGGTASAEIGDLFSPSAAVWSLGAGLAQPLYQGGRLAETVRRNRARVEEALNRYRETALGAFREVEQALAAESWLRRQAQALAGSVAQTAASRELAVYSYRQGLTDILTLLDSYRSTFSAESEQLAVRRELLTNRIGLYLALGGGF